MAVSNVLTCFFKISGCNYDPVFERCFLLLFSALTMDNYVYYCFINTKLVTNEMSKRERLSWSSQGGGGDYIMT